MDEKPKRKRTGGRQSLQVLLGLPEFLVPKERLEELPEYAREAYRIKTDAVQVRVPYDLGSILDWLAEASGAGQKATSRYPGRSKELLRLLLMLLGTGDGQRLVRAELEAAGRYPNGQDDFLRACGRYLARETQAREEKLHAKEEGE